jgi:hypothetical protein
MANAANAFADTFGCGSNSLPIVFPFIDSSDVRPRFFQWPDSEDPFEGVVEPRSMKKYILIGLAVVGITTAFTSSARAEFSINISLGFPFPQPPVIVAPRPPAPCTPPVVVVRPPVVHRPPVVVAPCRPVVISRPVFMPPGQAKKYGRDWKHRNKSHKWKKGRH